LHVVKITNTVEVYFERVVIRRNEKALREARLNFCGGYRIRTGDLYTASVAL
tara:strand:+ start:407 stop:562 length:156 start_codon:yes stop_codon:yes gene_type:complete